MHSMPAGSLLVDLLFVVQALCDGLPPQRGRETQNASRASHLKGGSMGSEKASFSLAISTFIVVSTWWAYSAVGTTAQYSFATPANTPRAARRYALLQMGTLTSVGIAFPSLIGRRALSPPGQAAVTHKRVPRHDAGFLVHAEHHSFVTDPSMQAMAAERGPAPATEAAAAHAIL